MHRKQYWTDTFLNIMQHVRREQQRCLDASKK